MANNKELAESIALKIPYQPMDDRILVKPLKTIMVTKELPVETGEQIANVEEAEKTERKLEKRKVPSNIQKGIIIKLGREYTEVDENGEYKKNPEKLEIGDVVLFPHYAGQPFELFKDSKIFRRYELVGVER